jgi:hypothetical protein
LQNVARKHSRHGHRDATAILIAYCHGLRAGELCELTWNMIELDTPAISAVGTAIEAKRPACSPGCSYPWRTRRKPNHRCKALIMLFIHGHAVY